MGFRSERISLKPLSPFLHAIPNPLKRIAKPSSAKYTALADFLIVQKAILEGFLVSKALLLVSGAALAASVLVGAQTTPPSASAQATTATGMRAGYRFTVGGSA